MIGILIGCTVMTQVFALVFFTYQELCYWMNKQDAAFTAILFWSFILGVMSGAILFSIL